VSGEHAVFCLLSASTFGASKLWTSKDDTRMILVPAGRFTMGSEHGDKDEMPVHQAYLAFYIDETPVA
jgi:formylglycine-generating enzyme required for sulfatase activity